MPMPTHKRRGLRVAVAALGAAGLIALAVAPAALADEGPSGLVVGGIEPVAGVKPGSVLDVSATVGNKGTGAAEKVWVSYSVTRGLDFAEVPSNCQVQHVRSYDEMPERWTAACAFDQAVEPGVVYTPQKPILVKVLDRALNDDLRVRVSDVDPGADDNGDAPVTGTAPAVKLVEGPAGGAGTARLVDVHVTAVNTADYQVTGAVLRGRIGDTVTMKVKFTQAGPAWVQPRPGDQAVSVKVRLPGGTSAVKPGQFCRVEGSGYSCGMRSLYEGTGETYTFQLKIDKRVAGARGSVALSTEARPFDHDKTNDRADIVLDVTGGGSTGSTGGSAGGPDDAAGASTNGSTSSTGSTGNSTAGPGGSSSTGGNGSATSGGNLAETGASTLPMAGAAAAAVVGGAGALVIVRCRRTRNPK